MLLVKVDFPWYLHNNDTSDDDLLFEEEYLEEEDLQKNYDDLFGVGFNLKKKLIK